MRRQLDDASLKYAVLGGLILGGGGGGHVNDGLELGKAALAAGPIQLVDADELSPDALVAICAGVGAPGAPDQFVSTNDYVTALELLIDRMRGLGMAAPAAVATNENGAMATINGWLQAARLGLPVIDCPCNGRAHPTGVMGSLGLHRDPDYCAVAAFAGGRGSQHVDGVVSGALDATAKLVREASVLAGGLVAVARNPVSVDLLKQRGAPGGISQAIAVGQAARQGGVEAVAELLGGRVVASGPVRDFTISQVGGYDIGRLSVAETELTFANEYMTLESRGETLAEFPDLIMTFRDEYTPIVSADLLPGQRVLVLTAPRTSLKLSATMSMPELFKPVQAMLRGEAPNVG